MWRLLLCLLALAPGLAPADTAFAPTPYTAQQIREATRSGRTYEFLVERPDAQPARRRMRFTAVTSAGAIVERAMFDEKAKVWGEPTRTHTSWDEMRDHTKYPLAAATIEADTITIPAGTFACRRYTVVEAGDGRTIAWFANGLPGPPVKLRKEAAGRLVMTMTLHRYAPGGH